MAAVIVTLIDAVVDLLNAQQPLFTDALAYACVRSYDPVYELARDMADLRVTVYPRSSVSQRASRGHATEESLGIDVAIQQRVPGETNGLDESRVDQLLGLVEEVRDYLMETPISSPNARLLTVENEPVYWPEHLDRLRQFTSVLALTYQLWRP